MSKVAVQPEGHRDIYIPDRASLKAFLTGRGLHTIHNFIPGGPVIVGADHSLESVLGDIDRAVRLAIVLGEACRTNMNHALALVMPAGNGRAEHLELYDIGKITEADLQVNGDTDENRS